MSASISRRLVFWLAVPLMLLALGGALIHYLYGLAPGVISSDRRLRSATGALMAHVRVAQGALTLEAGPPGGPPLPAADDLLYALRDPHGRLLAGDPRLPPVALDGVVGQQLGLARIGQRTLRTLSTRFDTAAGLILITVADLHPAAEPATRLGLMNTLLWDFVQLDLTLVLVWFGIQLGLRPIKRLREDIGQRSPHDLRPIDETSVARELAPMVQTLNRLFQTLRSSAQARQQFIANTAHQLRTPITGMQAQLELLAAEPAAAPLADRITLLNEGIRRLAHSANQLLTLARADPTANLSTRNKSVELSTIVGEVAAKFFDRAIQSSIDLGVDASPVTLVADPALLDDLLGNLVDNALKYTPAGGRVTVASGRREGRPYLAVEDTGPGIPVAERERVWQRFYRLPNSPGHGSGLGRAIVEEIARLYGAHATLDTGAGGQGTRVTVLFPAG